MRFGDALFSDKPKLDGDAVHSRARYVQMQMDADVGVSGNCGAPKYHGFSY
jgi:hypothetical protein